MRRIAAVVPVKALEDAKGRLRPTLAEKDRRDLVLWMLDRVLAALGGCEAVSEVAVITPDEDVGAAAARAGARGVIDTSAGLNVAVGRALARAAAEGFEGALVALADLPGLTVADVRRILAAAGPQPSAVVVPDRREEGTNLLYLSPPDLIRPRFGVRSFAAHQSALAGTAARAHVYRSESTGLDVDTPDDLAELGVRLGTAPALASGHGASTVVEGGHGG